MTVITCNDESKWKKSWITEFVREWFTIWELKMIHFYSIIILMIVITCKFQIEVEKIFTDRIRSRTIRIRYDLIEFYFFRFTRTSDRKWSLVTETPLCDGRIYGRSLSSFRRREIRNGVKVYLIYTEGTRNIGRLIFHDRTRDTPLGERRGGMLFDPKMSFCYCTRTLCE